MSTLSMGFDNDDIKSSNFEKFKGDKGKKYRIGFVAKNFEKALVGAQQHFLDKPFLCKSTKEEQAICCTHNYPGNTAKWKIGGAIIIYQLGKGADGKPAWGPDIGDYEIKPWIFNDKVYSQLKTFHKEWDLAEHDILLECTDSQYQSFTLSITKNCLWSREGDEAQEKMKAKILQEAAKVTKAIPRNLGQDLTLTEIREVLGLDGAGAGDAAEDMDMSDIADDLD